MLDTELKHLEIVGEAEALIKSEDNVMICAGRMGPMCIPVYVTMKNLEEKYPNVQMRDMDFDIPAASFIRDLPACMLFMGLPFMVYFKKGVVVEATSSMQSKEEIISILDRVFK